MNNLKKKKEQNIAFVYVEFIIQYAVPVGNILMLNMRK